jgi:plasmid stability protein
MPTLVLRNVPDDLYQRLKETAAEHRRSMTQEAIVSLRTALDRLEEPPPKPGLEETLEWLRREVWSLPVLDQRSDNEILGYNEDDFSKTDVRIAEQPAR